MKTTIKLLLSASVLSISSGLMAQSADVFDPAEPVSVNVPQGSPAVWAGRGTNVLFDNGPLVNSVGTGAGGADESILQGDLGMLTLGAGHQIAADNLVADDFTVPVGGWTIDQIVFFGYQTGSTTTTTFNDYRVQIWDGLPDDPASSVVFGDTTTNVLQESVFSNIYRVSNTTGGATNRPIMANTATIGTTLPAGTYFVTWQAGGSLGSGPWAPPITITGQTSTGDGLQSTDAGVTYLPYVDGGDPTFFLGLPFIIEGTAGTPTLPESQPVPALGMSGLIIMILVLMGAALVVLRRA